MAYLGTPYRVLYEAKDLRSGLTNVMAMLIKPDNSAVGVFNFTEFQNQNFHGVYYFDLITSLTDLEGEWTGIIVSPSEPIRTTFRVSFIKNPIAEIQSLISNFLANGIREELQGKIDLETEFTAFANSSPLLTGYIKDELSESSVEDGIEVGVSDQTNNITGDIDHGLQ